MQRAAVRAPSHQSRVTSADPDGQMDRVNGGHQPVEGEEDLGCGCQLEAGARERCSPMSSSYSKPLMTRNARPSSAVAASTQKTSAAGLLAARLAPRRPS